MPDFELPIDSVKSSFTQFKRLGALPGGGQKLVYHATDAEGRSYALKIIRQDRGPQDERTIREVMAAGKLNAPFFPKIFDAQYCRINETNCIYIVEEFIDGQSLATILEEQGAQSRSSIREIGTALLEALVHIEQADLVHRDIKPGNIMIGPGGRVVIIDFGIARHLDQKSITSPYAFFGPMTVGYCAPDQIR